MQGSSNNSTVWGLSHLYIRNHVRTGARVPSKQEILAAISTRKLFPLFHLGNKPWGYRAQQVRCSSCAEQSDLEKDSFLTLNLENGLTWSVETSHISWNVGDTSGLLAA